MAVGPRIDTDRAAAGDQPRELSNLLTAQVEDAEVGAERATAQLSASLVLYAPVWA